jgi:hypothetical protein
MFDFLVWNVMASIGAYPHVSKVATLREATDLL